jgi:aromatic-L-amino-acid decarboxylase
VDWIADYLENVEQYPVKSQVKPREIINNLPNNPPTKSEDFNAIMEDFVSIILPGITHWQHPSFFAYFPANSSKPSVLAEMLTSVIGAQCMMWDTSPAAAELEEQMMNWLKYLIHLPSNFEGVIQDTASTSTLCSLLTAREVKTSYGINSRGYYDYKTMKVYCSSETHSSIEKAVKIMGVGKENLQKIPVDLNFCMDTQILERTIQEDLKLGFSPLAVVATLGTTGSGSVDPLKKIGNICEKYDIWLHVDAAYAGSTLILSEKQWIIEGIEKVDTFVFNPHKWLFTNFDCSAYFVRDSEALVKTFEILPEYLKSKSRGVNNYRDWGIPLGRRFRALKLWFVIRSYGKRGLIETIRSHIELASMLKDYIRDHEDFELLAPVHFALVCFRFHPLGIDDEQTLESLNTLLLERLNMSGKLYLTHTKLGGVYTLRFSIGQTEVQRNHVQNAWKQIVSMSSQLKSEKNDI